MRNILLLCLFFCSSVIAYSQTITVQDAQTSEPIEMVSIVSEERNEFMSTDKYGNANISLLEGAQKIQFQNYFRVKVLGLSYLGF
jgi:hemoglobin/transferrin/lactoferrin receptor protein